MLCLDLLSVVVFERFWNCWCVGLSRDSLLLLEIVCVVALIRKISCGFVDVEMLCDFFFVLFWLFLQVFLIGEFAAVSGVFCFFSPLFCLAAVFIGRSLGLQG